ncbi:MAG TPA: RIP metalloprotease RseP [Cryomorphaceae bacterium]|nr:RIP metalloprotease RseP [Cryomorphaceae bacterium]
MEILVKASQFILSLSLLIVLHELGHFIPAKIFKTRVEKFYLFFDPWFALFKKKIGETEYGIGWLPLGGYVKISGMIDESMDTEQMKQEPKPYEFRSKPAWQRLIIMVGGVTVNVLLAFVIYAMMLFTWGKEYIPMENLTYGVHVDSLLLDNGFEQGDKILAVEGHAPKTLPDITAEILYNDARNLVVERDGRKIDISLPEDIDQEILRRGGQGLFFMRYPAVVDSVLAGGPADKAGLRKGDRVLAIDESPVESFQELVMALQTNKGQSISLRVENDGAEREVNATVDENGQLQFFATSPLAFFETEKEEFGFFESFPAGVKEGTDRLVSYVRSLKLIFSSEGVKQVGGFLTIGSLFDTTWNWQRFWNMTALLSIILAVMNILPIPALDGGHVMFLLYEIIAGRKPGDKFMEYAQLAGIAILLTLLLYANGMDVFRFFFDG